MEEELAELMGRMGAHFARVEPFAQAGKYVRGLLSDLPRTGAEGIGKTTLAVHWAHRISARFPDGQLYVNLRGSDPGRSAAKPAEVVRGFLAAFAVPVRRIPAGLEAQVGLYRSLLVALWPAAPVRAARSWSRFATGTCLRRWVWLLRSPFSRPNRSRMPSGDSALRVRATTAPVRSTTATSLSRSDQSIPHR